MKLLIGLLAPFCLAGAANAVPPVLKMNSPNTYEINIHSQGCFHNDSSGVVIKDGIMLINDQRSQPLTPDVLAGMNLYFYALDLEPMGGCTTTTTYSISETTPEGRISNWELVDGSCMMSIPGAAGNRLPAGTDWSRMLTPDQVVYASEELTSITEGGSAPDGAALEQAINLILKENEELAEKWSAISERQKRN